MSHEDTPLSADERAELDRLRAEKAAREDRERARRERAELDRLRREKDDRAARDRARAIMEPGDDLSMPLGQKIVLGVLALIVIAVIAVYLFASH